MNLFLKRFEGVIVRILAMMMALLILLSVFGLVIALVRDLWSSPYYLPAVDELLDIFGLFLIILLGLELLETIRAYLREDVIHVEVVLVVAIIAVARKVIVLDLKSVPGTTIIGEAAILIALSWGYYLIKQVHAQQKKLSKE